MRDDLDRSGEPRVPEVRRWFVRRKTALTPPSPHAFFKPRGAGPATSVRRMARTFRTTPVGRLVAFGTALTIILVAGGLLVVSGGSGPVGPSASLPPSTLPSLSARVSPSPSASAFAQATTAPSRAPASAPTPIDDGGLFGTSGMWAAHGNHLYLSTDYGSSWVQRSLAPGVTLNGAPGDILSNVFMLDTTHAWSASPGPGSTPYGGQGPPFDKLHVVVSRTSDGGRTWQSVTVPGDWGGSKPVLAFADVRHGYLLIAGLRGGGASAVLATADGGVTWRLVHGGSGILGSIFGVSGSGTLWSGNQGDAGPVGRPVFDVSRDGGRTWSDARLPGLVGDIYVNDTLVAPPVFSGSNGAAAVLAESSANPPEFRFFRTTSRGLSWVQVASIAQNENGSVAVAVIDATHFVAVDPAAGVVRRTSDGGATWQSSPMSGSGIASRLRFWAPEYGSAVVSHGIIRTTDGGRTWMPAYVTAVP